MKRVFIIPVKTYLYKYLEHQRSLITDVFNEKTWWEDVGRQRSIIYTILPDYDGYRINQKMAFELYCENKLYKKIRLNEYPKDLLIDWPATKYIYLKFYLPTHINKDNETYSKQNKEFLRGKNIKIFNLFFDWIFWRQCVISILQDRETSIDSAISKFYSDNKLTNQDYNPSSFKTMLYKKAKQK